MTKMHEWGVALLVVAGALGCTAAPPSRTPAALPDNLMMKLGVLGSLVPCKVEAAPTVPPDAPPPPPPPVGGRPVPFEPGVYVEMAILEVPAQAGENVLARDLRALTLDPAVRVLGAPQVFVVPSRPTRMVVEEHFGPLGALALRDFTVASRTTDTKALILDFTVGLDLPTARDVVNAEPWRIEVRATTSMRDRTLSAFAKGLPADPSHKIEVVFTPYVVRTESDVHALFACKMARRKRATGD